MVETYFMFSKDLEEGSGNSSKSKIIVTAQNAEINDCSAMSPNQDIYITPSKPQGISWKREERM